MRGGLELIRERMTEYLTSLGVQALTAWPGQERMKREDCVVVVSLRKCQTGPSGFQDYLGERYNEDTASWEELYGKRVELTFGLDLYAPAAAGEEAIQRTFDQLSVALQEGGPEGLTVRTVSCGETVYDQAGRLLRRSVEAECSAYLYAIAEAGGAFLDFDEYIGSCKYRKCTHTVEEGCAVLEAVEQGKIAKTRHESYVTLYNELKNKPFWEEKNK